MLKVSSRSCETTILVMPRVSLSRRISCAAVPREMGSSPANGSSYMIRSGSSAMARASATRLAMPPEICEGIRSRAPRRPTALSFMRTMSRTRPSDRSVCSRRGKGNVVEHAQVGEQGAELEQHAHAAPRRVEAVRIERADLLPVERAVRLPGANLAADQPQHRGLAAAGGAHERRHLAARHGKAQVVEDAALAIAKAQVAAFNERRGVRIGHPAGRAGA